MREKGADCLNPLLSGSVFLTRQGKGKEGKDANSRLNPLLSGSVFLTEIALITRQFPFLIKSQSPP